MRRFSRAAALLLPLLLVNSAAVYGQAGWAYDHLIRSAVIAVLFAASVESIGIYLAYEAHSALMAGDASARLRLGSYLVGVLAGVLNYAHFASVGYRPNPLAVTFGLLSSMSPWLWAIRSRSLNRDRLRELGQIDPRAVRFSTLRWALFPIRTVRAFRAAVWAGIVQPSEAIAAADARREARRSERRVATHEAPRPVPAPPIALSAKPRRARLNAEADPAGQESGSDREPVPTATGPRRQPPVPDQRLLRRLADPEAVPRRADGTVPVRLVEDALGVGQKRAVRLLQKAGLYRAGDTGAVPEPINGAVPATEGVPA